MIGGGGPVAIIAWDIFLASHFSMAGYLLNIGVNLVTDRAFKNCQLIDIVRYFLDHDRYLDIIIYNLTS